MRALLKPFPQNENGAVAMEYGLIVSLVTIVCIAGFIALGSGSSGMWDKIRDLVGASLR